MQIYIYGGCQLICASKAVWKLKSRSLREGFYKRLAERVFKIPGNANVSSIWRHWRFQQIYISSF